MIWSENKLEQRCLDHADFPAQIWSGTSPSKTNPAKKSRLLRSMDQAKLWRRPSQQAKTNSSKEKLTTEHGPHSTTSPISWSEEPATQMMPFLHSKELKPVESIAASMKLNLISPHRESLFINNDPSNYPIYNILP